MRRFQNPETQRRVIEYYQMGMSGQDICYLITGKTVTTALRAEQERDKEFAMACGKAMEDPFRSVLQTAISLAGFADIEGEYIGAHKALDIVMRHYDKHLDRKVKMELSTRALQEATTHGPQGSMVLGPGGVRELVSAVAEQAVASSQDVLDLSEVDETPELTEIAELVEGGDPE